MKDNERLALLVSLRQVLAERFNLEDIQTLCFELGIDFEDLGGQGKAGKARELVGYAERRGLVSHLVSAGERIRPDIPWRELAAPDNTPDPPGYAPAPAGRDPSRPARILFLAANPGGTGPLKLDEEIREIERALRLAKFRDRFDIFQQWAVRISDLQDHLLRFEPDIVHFSGHGSTTSEIILEDQDGFGQAVSQEALSNLFRTLKGNIRCVVLNACFSETQARAIAEHIDCVVGMNKAIGDQSAINFASAFYRGLGYGRDVRTAFDLGIGQIDLQGLAEHQIPQLITLKPGAGETVFVSRS